MTYDRKTGSVRSFFGVEFEQMHETTSSLTPTAMCDDFLNINCDLFNLSNINLCKTGESEGAASQSVRYEQYYNGIPVYEAQLVVGLRKGDGTITSAVNKVDYDILTANIPKNATLNVDQVVEKVCKRFSALFESIELGTPTLFYYLHVKDESAELDQPMPPIRKEMLDLGAGNLDQLYLVWQILMETKEPNGIWELMVDTVNGELVAVRDKRRYVNPKGYIFCPDPIRSKMDDGLCWSTEGSILNDQLVEVTLENLNAPVDSKYRLDGIRVLSLDTEQPNFTPPETTDDFKYKVKYDDGSPDYGFLSVMAYYYLDRLIEDIVGYGIPAYNNSINDHPIEVDAQGCDGVNNSWFAPVNPPYIAFGTDTREQGVPGAQDPGIIVHEYGHAIHYFLNSKQLYDHEHWLCDFLAVAWIDRYNKNQYLREEIFPWNNNTGNAWSNFRRVDLVQRFDDPCFSEYPNGLKGSIGATALWDWFIIIGGQSSNENIRKWSADEVIRTYLEMLLLVTQNTTKENLANALITADANRTGGLYRKVIWDAFRRRGMWSDFTPAGNVDLYIRDSDTDAGGHTSPQIHWNSPDIWVRNSPPPADPNDPNDPNHGENPDDGHQLPINNIPNYIYARVHNRGSQEAAAYTFTVETFRCSSVKVMLWPTHFQSIGKLPITEPIPANGGSVRVGPFIWTPQIVGNDCLLVIVNGSRDPSIADAVNAKGTVDHCQLVKFDNNVGQRYVVPVNFTNDVINKNISRSHEI